MTGRGVLSRVGKQFQVIKDDGAVCSVGMKTNELFSDVGGLRCRDISWDGGFGLIAHSVSNK